MSQLIHTIDETPITFGDSAQSPTVTITLANLSAAAGRVSARHDRGAGAKATCYKWRATFQIGATAVVGETIDLYLATSDGTHPDGEIGTADAALSTSAKLRNLIYLGSVSVEVTTSNTDVTASGVVEVPDRYLSLVVYNATTKTLRNDTSVHKVSLIPFCKVVNSG